MNVCVIFGSPFSYRTPQVAASVLGKVFVNVLVMKLQFIIGAKRILSCVRFHNTTKQIHIKNNMTVLSNTSVI